MMNSKPFLCMFLVVLLAVSVLLTGCATPQNPYTYQGAGLGAAVGAAIGAGTNGKNPWKGAAIGALLGGAAGGIAGEMYGRSNPYCPPQLSASAGGLLPATRLRLCALQPELSAAAVLRAKRSSL
jgi:hypothetical protein